MPRERRWVRQFWLSLGGEESGDFSFEIGDVGLVFLDNIVENLR
jgi:hypothetical protein